MKILIRTFLLFIATPFYFKSYSQPQLAGSANNSLNKILIENTWVSDSILGLDPKVEMYKLTKYNPQGKFSGNVTHFVDSSTFYSEYTSWCGNDYFTKLAGQYKISGSDKISFKVKEVSYSGEWTKPTEHRKVNYVTFAISMVGDTVVLRKQRD